MGGMAAVIGGLAYTWLPNGDYERIRKGEKGTVTEGIAAIAEAPSGRPSLVSQQRAADEGRLMVPPDEAVPVTTTPTPSQRAPETTVAPNRIATTLTPTTRATPASTTTTVGARPRPLEKSCAV